jgi:methylphosphotriester-DNA--protein-cysteine methyltransferase
MPAQTSSEVRAAILAHHHHGLSGQKIVDQLKNTGIFSSKSTVNRIVKEFYLDQSGVIKPAKRLATQCSPVKRTKELIRKVDRITNKANPPTQRQLAERYGVSRSTIRRILKDDLGAELMRKRKTHALSNKQAQQRLDRGPRFLQLIGGNKCKYIISLDEAWLSLNDVNGIRGVYYKKTGKPTPPSWTKKWRKKHAKKVMYAAGVCAKGVTDLYFVPPTTKVDRWFFINSILKPIVEKDIPRLYPGEEHKVVLHFDSAGSHTTPEVYAWLDERNVKYIRKEEWLSNSPDLSPMDFGPNGIFKQILFGKKATGLDGLKRVARQVWAGFPLATCVNTMKSWPGRVKKMIESQGFQIENLKK